MHDFTASRCFKLLPLPTGRRHSTRPHTLAWPIQSWHFLFRGGFQWPKQWINYCAVATELSRRHCRKEITVLLRRYCNFKATVPSTVALTNSRENLHSLHLHSVISQLQATVQRYVAYTVFIRIQWSKCRSQSICDNYFVYCKPKSKSNHAGPSS